MIIYCSSSDHLMYMKSTSERDLAIIRLSSDDRNIREGSVVLHEKTSPEIVDQTYKPDFNPSGDDDTTLTMRDV